MIATATNFTTVCSGRERPWLRALGVAPARRNDLPRLARKGFADTGFRKVRAQKETCAPIPMGRSIAGQRDADPNRPKQEKVAKEREIYPYRQPKKCAPIT